MGDDVLKRLREIAFHHPDVEWDGEVDTAICDAIRRIEALEAERDVVADELGRLRRHNESLRRSLDQKPFPSDVFVLEEELAAEVSLGDVLALAISGDADEANAALDAWRDRRNGGA